MLVSQGVSIYIANAAAFCVGTVVNVVLIRKFVFKNNRFQLGVDLPLTFLVNGMMLGIGMVLLWLLVELALLNPYLAKLLTNGTTFVINYIIRAIFFRKK